MTVLKQQRLLGIESTGFAVSIGVMDKGVPIGALYLNDGSPGSQTLLSTIDNLLTTLKFEKESFDGICVSRGPGSFTSLRISLSTAEAMGLGLKIPVYAVDTLTLIAATLPFYDQTIKVVQNAYKGEFYTASYVTKSGEPEEIEPLRLIKPGDFYDALGPGDLILGNGVEQLVDAFNLPAKKVVWHTGFHRVPSGISVIERFLDRESVPPSNVPIEPIYIRLSDAEINYSNQFKDR